LLNSGSTSFINETKSLLNNRNNRKLTQDIVLPILDSFLARLEEGYSPPVENPSFAVPNNSIQQQNQQPSVTFKDDSVNKNPKNTGMIDDTDNVKNSTKYTEQTPQQNSSIIKTDQNSITSNFKTPASSIDTNNNNNKISGNAPPPPAPPPPPLLASLTDSLMRTDPLAELKQNLSSSSKSKGDLKEKLVNPQSGVVESLKLLTPSETGDNLKPSSVNRLISRSRTELPVLDEEIISAPKLISILKKPAGPIRRNSKKELNVPNSYQNQAEKLNELPIKLKTEANPREKIYDPQRPQGPIKNEFKIENNYQLKKLNNDSDKLAKEKKLNKETSPRNMVYLIYN
jgi:hypothetical protein